MERIRGLSTGTKLMLVTATALFLNLSLTWQKLTVDFGPGRRVERLLDGWDAWGLLIGLLALALIALVVVANSTDVERAPDRPWDRIVLALGLVVFVLTLVKNLTDANSTLASYVGVALAALVVLGGYLDLRRTRARESSSTVEAS